MNNLPLLSYEDFIMQDDEDKYMMLQESEAYIKHYHSIIKEIREYIGTERFLYNPNFINSENITKILDKENKND